MKMKITSKVVGNIRVISLDNEDSGILNQAKLKSRRKIRNFIIGPHWMGVLMTVVVIFGAWWLFLELLKKGKIKSPYSVILKVIIGMLCILSVIFLTMTALSDSGIVALHPKHSELIDREGFCEDEDYCDICNISVPSCAKVRHCFECNVCVIGQDHHCVWMGQCIGRKNMKWFIYFNISWLIGFALLLIIAIFF